MDTYEKKYNEALERARALWREAIEKEYVDDYLKDYETIFPELRESEDEMVRQSLIDLVNYHFSGEERDAALTYLEKQKEFFKHGYGLYYYHNGGFTFVARPAEEEKQKEHPIPWYDYQKSKEAGYTIVPNEEYEQLIKRKEPKPAWSEEDEDRIRQIERITQQAGCTQKLQEEIHDWLKSLRPQQKQEWSDEDERIVGRIQMILEFFDRNYPADMNIGSEVPKYISWLKSLRPSWKPSEELLDSLRDTIVQTKGYSYSMYLPELYEQLKKL